MKGMSSGKHFEMAASCMFRVLSEQGWIGSCSWRLSITAASGNKDLESRSQFSLSHVVEESSRGKAHGDSEVSEKRHWRVKVAA